VVSHAEFGAHVDEHLLDPTHVRDHVDRLAPAGAGQREDRVADQWPAVPRDLPAAVDVDDRRAVGRALPRLRTFARRVHARMFEEQYGVRLRPAQHAFLRPALLVPGGDVIDGAEPAHRRPVGRPGGSGGGRGTAVGAVAAASPEVVVTSTSVPAARSAALAAETWPPKP